MFLFELMSTGEGSVPRRKNSLRAPSEHSIGAFLDRVDNHSDTKKVKQRLDRLLQDVRRLGGTNVTQWSRLTNTVDDEKAELRRALHERILRMNLFADAHAKKPTAAILLGPPGAGKTSIGVPLVRTRFNVSFININADDVKEHLPGYEGWNAAAFHEESSHVAENLIRNEATAARLNVIYDITGKDTEKVRMGIRDFAQYGYRVYLMLLDLPPWKAAWRVWKRFQQNPFGKKPWDPGRFVYPRWVYNEGAKPKQTFDALKKTPAVKGYVRVNADSPRGEPPIIVEQEVW